MFVATLSTVIYILTIIPGTRFTFHSPSPPFKFWFWSDCQQFMTSTVPQTVASTQLRGTTPRGGDFRKDKNLLSQLCHSKHSNMIPPSYMFLSPFMSNSLQPKSSWKKPKPKSCNRLLQQGFGFVFFTHKIWLRMCLYCFYFPAQFLPACGYLDGCVFRIAQLF